MMGTLPCIVPRPDQWNRCHIIPNLEWQEVQNRKCEKCGQMINGRKLS
jgi:hypothetical protein